MWDFLKQVKTTLEAPTVLYTNIEMNIGIIGRSSQAYRALLSEKIEQAIPLTSKYIVLLTYSKIIKF